MRGVGAAEGCGAPASLAWAALGATGAAQEVPADRGRRVSRLACDILGRFANGPGLPVGEAAGQRRPPGKPGFSVSQRFTF